ncbi:MAG: hypothetical protein H0T62_14060 [Parachlamydiaceae bacterium]|nr:hypothetical protein [Parachlamydiaceae bacterium]
MSTNYGHLYDSHLYTNSPYLDASQKSADYSSIPFEQITNPHLQTQPEPISYNYSNYPSHVPVFMQTFPSGSSSSPDYTQTLHPSPSYPDYTQILPSSSPYPDYTQTLPLNPPPLPGVKLLQTSPIRLDDVPFKAQLINKEAENENSCIKAIDIVAALIFIAFTATIITLAVMINPFIAFGLIALVPAIPAYIYCRCDNEPEEPTIIPFRQDDYLSTNPQAVFEGDPTQTLQPEYKSYNGYNGR